MIKFLNKFLWLIAFITGVSSLGMEIAFFRLLAPYFGASIFVSSAVIGVVLLCLSVGYYFGGKISEQKPDLKVLLRIILVTGLLFLIIPWITNPVSSFISGLFLEGTFNTNVFFVAIFLVALILFGLPMVLLGMTSPFLVKIYSLSNDKPGESAGLIFASSTIGSLVGSFLPTLWLIPVLGTRTTILLFAGVLILLGLAGITVKKSVPIVALLIISTMGGFSYDKTRAQNILYKGESVYQHLQVVEDDKGARYLLSNEGIGYESVYDPNKVLTNTFYDYFSLLPELCVCEDKKKILVVGLAGATIPRQMKNIYRDSVEIDGVEIDAKVVELARKYFDLNKLGLNVYTGEGRTYLSKTDKKYDVIIIDAFQNELYIPWTLTTLEFWETVKSKLTAGGVVAINVNSDGNDSELLRVIANTQAAVFKNVFIANNWDHHNYMLVAGENELDFTNLSQSTNNLLASQAQTVSRAKKISYDPKLMVLTDDRAPIESITDKMLVKYFGSTN